MQILCSLISFNVEVPPGRDSAYGFSSVTPIGLGLGNKLLIGIQSRAILKFEETKKCFPIPRFSHEQRMHSICGLLRFKVPRIPPIPDKGTCQLEVRLAEGVALAPTRCMSSGDATKAITLQKLSETIIIWLVVYLPL